MQFNLFSEAKNPRILHLKCFSLYCKKCPTRWLFSINTKSVRKTGSQRVTRDELVDIPIANDQCNTLENTLVIIFIE